MKIQGLPYQYYVCKACGRSMISDEKPNFCYADRMDSIENISDEDAVKMGLSIPKGTLFEFPGDARWGPVKGRPMDLREWLKDNNYPAGTLSQFQDKIMEEVRK